MKQKVIIIGHGYTSRLCVIRSVAQLGCDITVIVIAGKKKDGSLNTKKPIDCYSKYVNRILYCKSDADMLIQLLLEKCVDSNQKVVIIPDSDFSAVVIDSNQDKLKEHFLFPHINHEQGAVMKWMNKEKQKEMAMSVGLNVAESISVEIKDGKYLFPKHVHYPCFTKTQLFLNRNKQTLKRCNNSDELQRNLDKLSLEYGNLTIMIEEYKEIENEYAILGFSDGREVIIPGVIQILNIAHGVHYGVACRGKVMPVDGFEEQIEKFKQFVLRVGFVGVFDIDFYLSDGIFYFCELNLRIGGSCYAITKMGVNLPAMLVKCLCGENIGSMSKEIKESAVFVNERMCLDDWYYRDISTKEYCMIIESSNISFIKEKDDDGPYKAYKGEFRKRQIKRVIKKLYDMRTELDYFKGFCKRIGLLGVCLLIVLCTACSSEDEEDEPMVIMEYNASSEYIAVFGDIQYYTNPFYISLFQHSCNWILAQEHAGMNINSVLLVGDVTEQNSRGYWPYFESATQKLAQEIPYISAIGDHDYSWWKEDGYTIIDRYDTEFSKYLSFPLTKKKVVAWYEEGHMENVVIENYIHGLPIYLLVLEFGPRKGVVDWANEYVKGHPDIHFILMNHEYLEKGGGRRVKNLKCYTRLRKVEKTYTTPTQLWNRLIKKNDNILCVLCGHVGGLYAYTPEKNDFGREVPQIQHNIQSEAYRFDNWLMLWEFPKHSDSANVSIINTKSMKYFENKPILFKFAYRWKK